MVSAVRRAFNVGQEFFIIDRGIVFLLNLSLKLSDENGNPPTNVLIGNILEDISCTRFICG